MAATFTKLIFHVVFSTNDRQLLVVNRLRDELYRYIGGIVRNEKGALIEIGGMPDHVHLLARMSADTAVSDLVRLTKANSSKWANDRPGRKGPFRWQTGYAAFTISESQIAVVRRYIQNQARHHKQTSFKEELRALLERHRIEYDPRYV